MAYDLLNVVLVNYRRLKGAESYAEVTALRCLKLIKHCQKLRQRALRSGFGAVKSCIYSGEDYLPVAGFYQRTDLFDDLHESMIRMGSATGREDQVLAKLADLYEEQAEDEITRQISIIEPTLVAVLAVVIGAVLLSVVLPMAGILTSL